jgi:transglutaminase-like putative cysteine protease
MKRLLIWRAWWSLAALVLLVGCTSPGLVSSRTSSQPVRYRVLAVQLDPEAVEGYPQTVLYQGQTGNRYDVELELRLDPERSQDVPFGDYSYPPEVAVYLEPTALIQSDAPAVCDLAASLRQPGDDMTAYALRAARWTAKNIGYDQQLAQQIWDGEVDTQSALDTLERKKGTCSEYTNLYIALLRCQGIPARFVHGMVYKGMNHAWAEVYLEGAGWLPVDPQGGKLTSDRHIRLFAGRDFADIGVKLKEMKVSINQLTP